MKRILNPKALLVVVALGGLIVGFQNCSRVDFQAMEGGALKGNGDADQITLIDDFVATDNGAPQDDADDSDVTTPIVTTDDDTSTPPPPTTTDDDSNKMPPTVTDDDTTTPPPTVTDNDPTPTPPPMSEEVKKAWAECNSRLKKGALPVSAGGTIANLSGSKAFSSSSLNEVKSITGKTDVLRTGDTMGTINLVKDVSGTTYICGFDITKIENVNGNLTIVGGHVGSITSKSGTVKLIGGSVGEVTNSSGNFKFEEIN